MVTPPVPQYSLDDILDLEHKVLFVLGNSGEYYSTVWLFCSGIGVWLYLL